MAGEAGPRTVEMPRLRLRYSTIVNSGALLLRLAASIGFSIIVARRLPPGEYGLWGLVISLSNTLLVPLSFITTWPPREEVRGARGSGFTGLLAALAYGGLSAAALLAALGAVVRGEEHVPVVVGVLPAVMALSTYLRRLVLVFKPEATGYSMLVYELTRLPAAYILVADMRLGVSGAALAMAAGFLGASAYLLLEAIRLGALEPRLVPGRVSRWLRLAYLQAFPVSGAILRSFYRSYMKLLGAPLEAIARLNVGLAAEAPLLQAAGTGASQVVYAAMLRSVSAWSLEESLRLYLAFAGFMGASLAALSRPATALFRPEYVDAAPVMVVVAFHAVLLGLARLYSSAVAGAERFDSDPDRVPSARVVLSSSWGRVAIMQLASQALSYAGLALLLATGGGGPARQALLAAASMLAGSALAAGYSGYMAHRVVGAGFPVRSLAEVLTASGAAVAAYWLLGATAWAPARFWSGLEALLWALTLGALAYSAVLLAVSPWARGLARAALRALGRG
jgi:hypothetical protein